MVGVMKYDYLIVGAGLYGAVCARELTDKGYRCLVIDNRDHIGGNCYTENVDGINVHKYGPHIFHTSSKPIWDYVNRFSDFIDYKYSPTVNYKGELFSFPINLMTLYQLYGVKTPQEAKDKLEELKGDIKNPKNLEDYAISMVGKEIYEKFIYGYTKKQWRIDPKELPASIIKRIPIRTTFDNNYFNDTYQGIPVDGYTKMFEKMLEGIDVMLNTDWFQKDYVIHALNKSYWHQYADKIIYTGRVDKYFDYQFGELNYRSLRFETEKLDIEDYQGNSVVNYTDEETPFTRLCEWKHFDGKKTSHTIITKEYPIEWGVNQIPFYPINTEDNNKIYDKYKCLVNKESNVHFGGRLAEYKYYDMHQVIASAINAVNNKII